MAETRKSKQKSLNKLNIEEIKKKILKDLTVNKSIKKKSSSRQRAKNNSNPKTNPTQLSKIKNTLYQNFNGQVPNLLKLDLNLPQQFM